MKWAGAGLIFALLATANGAGYRFGVSDQAFYVPAVLRVLDPSLYPHDAPLIDAQARLILTDELLATISRATGASLEALFLAAYLVSLAILWAAIVAIGRQLFAGPWGTLALGAAFTLRHRISRTSANSFEPYFHPRMLAFGIGLLAVAALMRRRPWAALALVALSALVHVTTAIWFGVLVGVAMIVLDRRLMRIGLAAGAAAAAIAAWALTFGPLQGSLVRMDDAWLMAVSGKDSLFPTDWPVWAWIANLGLIVLLWAAHGKRQAGGRATPEDRAIVWGTTALVAIFLITLPAVAARLAFPVQLQISRVFWLVDFVATMYVIAAVVEGRKAATSTDERHGGARPVAIALASLLIAVSVVRGGYVMLVERPDRPLFEIGLAATPWHDAMRWLAQRPASIEVLADPGHGWKYGTSVRVSAERDVFLEDQKDSAIAIYSRDVALRVNERLAAIGNFDELTAARVAELAKAYSLDFLVTPHDLPLPLAYRNDRFRIYDLAPLALRAARR